MSQAPLASTVRRGTGQRANIPLVTLQEMKRAGRKIVGAVAWDYQIAQIADRAGVDLVSVGDSVGVNLWGQEPDEITLEEMLIVCKAVRRGVKRALVSFDLPSSSQGIDAALRMKEIGADMVKLLASAEDVRATVRAGVPVFAEFHGGDGIPTGQLVRQAKQLEEAGASLLDFRHSGPAAGEAVARAVSIPVVGGLGGGPWLDGRVRLAITAIGYGEKWLDAKTDTYAITAKAALDAFTALIADARAGRQIKG